MTGGEKNECYLLSLSRGAGFEYEPALFERSFTIKLPDWIVEPDVDASVGSPASLTAGSPASLGLQAEGAYRVAAETCEAVNAGFLASLQAPS